MIAPNVRIVFEWALFLAMVDVTVVIPKEAALMGLGALECRTRCRPKKSGLVILPAVMAELDDLLEKSAPKDSKASLTAIGLDV